MKIQSLIVLFALTLASSLFVGCEQKQLKENETVVTESVSKTLNTNTNDHRQEIIINNVVRVFMHEPNQYSVMSVSGDKLVVHDLRDYLSGTRVSLFTDVLSTNSMWVCYKESDGKEKTKDIEIHIHTPDDINGAGWIQRRGKSTVRGTTVEIK